IPSVACAKTYRVAGGGSGALGGPVHVVLQRVARASHAGAVDILRRRRRGDGRVVLPEHAERPAAAAGVAGAVGRFDRLAGGGPAADRWGGTRFTWAFRTGRASVSGIRSPGAVRGSESGGRCGIPAKMPRASRSTAAGRARQPE